MEIKHSDDAAEISPDEAAITAATIRAELAQEYGFPVWQYNGESIVHESVALESRTPNPVLHSEEVYTSNPVPFGFTPSNASDLPCWCSPNERMIGATWSSHLTEDLLTTLSIASTDRSIRTYHARDLPTSIIGRILEDIHVKPTATGIRKTGSPHTSIKAHSPTSRGNLEFWTTAAESPSLPPLPHASSNHSSSDSSGMPSLVTSDPQGRASRLGSEAASSGGTPSARAQAIPKPPPATPIPVRPTSLAESSSTAEYYNVQEGEEINLAAEEILALGMSSTEAYLYFVAHYPHWSARFYRAAVERAAKEVVNPFVRDRALRCSWTCLTS